MTACVAVVVVSVLQVFHYSLSATHGVSNETPTTQHALPSRCVLFVSRVAPIEQLLQVTSEYEERLRRCEYVPRFSFGRRILGDDGGPSDVPFL